MKNCFNKRISLGICLFIVLLTAAGWADRSYVVPTWYGYGMVERFSGIVRPYMIPSYYPYDRYAYGSYSYYDYGSRSPYYGDYAYYSSYNPYVAGQGVVTIDGLNIRSGPGKGKNVIGSLSKGERVVVLSRNGNWYYVRSLSRPGIFGYAYGEYISNPGYDPYWTAVPTYYYNRR